jgi:S-(hydroxymethyl)glutathione dehydrogenase / alcohol dehydrogenase
MTRTRAAIYVGRDDVRIEDVDLANPGPRDVVVRVEASGLCHSDLSVVNGSAPVPPPLVLGHEGAGTVEWAGPEVTRVKVGDRVIGSLSPVCGSCWHCTRAETHLCEGAMSLNDRRPWLRSSGEAVRGLASLGTFSDFMVVSEWSVVPVHTDLPAEQLALIGCGVSTGLGAVLNTAQPPVGSTVAVIGCGGVGASAVQGARISGASHVIVIEPVERKRQLALGIGATDCVDPGAGDPIEQIRDLTSGRGVDVAVEAVGSKALIDQAIRMTRRGGTTVIVGAPRFDVTFSIGAMGLVIDSRAIKGSYYGATQARRDFPRYVELIETGRLDLASIVNRRIGLADVPAALFDIGGEATRTVMV